MQYKLIALVTRKDKKKVIAKINCTPGVEPCIDEIGALIKATGCDTAKADTDAAIAKTLKGYKQVGKGKSFVLYTKGTKNVTAKKSVRKGTKKA